MSILVPARRVLTPFETPSKAGPIGAGAGPLLSEYSLNAVLKRTPQQTMAQAALLWREVGWIRSAERVISGAVAGSRIPGGEGKVGWHLEDPAGETIDASYRGDKRAIEVFTLLSAPQAKAEVGQKLTRREMWNLTSRHMGICGPAFWYKDQTDAYGIPLSYLYIRPDRLWPVADADGNLQYWTLDADKPGKKVRIELDDLLQFNLEPPDEGFFGIGLVVSAITKIQFGQALDRHATAVVASGGRLSGIISPKQGVIDNDNIYNQLVRDWRNITEQPEAAKRAQIVRYPIEFTKTVADMQQLEVVKLLSNNRDELLELWGVPLSQIGGNSPTGLNSGDVRKYDRAALIQNAVEPRCDIMSEVIQADLTHWERYLGWVPKFVFDVPQFSDDSSRHDLVDKDKIVPMKGWERRAQIGLDPLGKDVVDAQGRPIDDVVLIYSGSAGMSEVGIGPSQMSDVVAGGFAAPKPPTRAEEAATAAAPKVTPPVVAKAKLSQPDYVKVVLTDLSHQYPPELLTWVRTLTWEFDDKVKLSDIDGAVRPGAPRVSKVVDAIAAGIKVGADIDPLVLVRLPSQKMLLIANGYHRWKAADNENVKDVQAFIGTASVAGEDDVRAAITEMQEPAYEDKGPGKAGLRSAMSGFRSTVATEMLPRLTASASRVLAEQKSSVLGEVRLHHQHIVGHPADTSSWWKPDRWDALLLAALSGPEAEIAAKVAGQINAHKADLGVGFGPAAQPGRLSAQILAGVATRVTKINETTRDDLRAIIEQGAKEGLSPAELGDRIETYGGWDPYRAERIATTELRQSYNEASRTAYGEAGVSRLTAIDGDQDPACAARNGQEFSLDEAADEDAAEHPNGTLDWMPVVDENVGMGDGEDGKAQEGWVTKAAGLIAALTEQDDAGDEATRELLTDLATTIRAEARARTVEGKARDSGMTAMAEAIMALAQRENPAPVVHVGGPVVNLPAPVVKVQQPPKRTVTKSVTRDALGRIADITERES